MPKIERQEVVGNTNKFLIMYGEKRADTLRYIVYL